MRQVSLCRCLLSIIDCFHFFVLRLFERFYLGFSSSSSSYSLAAEVKANPNNAPAAAPAAPHIGPHTPVPASNPNPANSVIADTSTAA